MGGSDVFPIVLSTAVSTPASLPFQHTPLSSASVGAPNVFAQASSCWFVSSCCKPPSAVRAQRISISSRVLKCKTVLETVVMPLHMS